MPDDAAMDGSLRRARATFAALVALVLAGLLVAMVSPAMVFAATDTDHDGLPNTWERTVSHTDPAKADTNGNGIPDGQEDSDHDGLTTLFELRRSRTDPAGRGDSWAMEISLDVEWAHAVASNAKIVLV